MANKTVANIGVRSNQTVISELTASVYGTASVSLAAISASYSFSGSYAVSASWAPIPAIAPTASLALTASHLYQSGSELSLVNSTNYFAGNKRVGITTTFLPVLTVTLPPSGTAIVETTFHGQHSSGPVVFFGRHTLQKDDVYAYSQPGNILEEYNQNLTVHVQSQLPDILYTTNSGVLAIQLKTITGTITGSLIYQVWGNFTAIDQPFTASTTASFGDTFDTYALGPISLLYADSPVYSSNAGVIAPSLYGIVASENINAYTSGSTPPLNSGGGWAAIGVIN